MKTIRNRARRAGAFNCPALLASLLLAFGGQVQAQTQEPGARWGLLAPSLFVSQDSDDFNVLKAGGGLLPLYQDGNHYTGLKAANHHFATGDWSKDSTQVSLARTAINPRDGLGYQASVGLNTMGSRQLVTADVDYSFALNASTNAGFFFYRDWVETRNSLDNGISLNYLGGSLEHRWGNGLTLIGLLAQHHFSDDNIRTHARGRLIYDLLPEQGINIQLRHRHFWNSNQPNGNYFNPDVYYENMLALGIKKRFEGWLLAGTLGVGRQKVSSDPEATTHLAELELTSPLTARTFFRTRLGYADSASFTGPNYIYKYLQADLIFSF